MRKVSEKVEIENLKPMYNFDYKNLFSCQFYCVGLTYNGRSGHFFPCSFYKDVIKIDFKISMVSYTALQNIPACSCLFHSCVMASLPSSCEEGTAVMQDEGTDTAKRKTAKNVYL